MIVLKKTAPIVGTLTLFVISVILLVTIDKMLLQDYRITYGLALVVIALMGGLAGGVGVLLASFVDVRYVYRPWPARYLRAFGFTLVILLGVTIGLRIAAQF